MGYHQGSRIPMWKANVPGIHGVFLNFVAQRSGDISPCRQPRVSMADGGSHAKKSSWSKMFTPTIWVIAKVFLIGGVIFFMSFGTGVPRIRKCDILWFHRVETTSRFFFRLNDKGEVHVSMFTPSCFLEGHQPS